MTTARASPTTTFIQQAGEGEVASITFDNTNAKITGELDDGTEFTTTGPLQSGIPEEDLATLRANDVEVTYETPSPNPLWSFLSFALPIILIIGVLLVDEPPGPGPDGRDHVHRPLAGQDLLHASARARPSPTSPATTGSSRRSPRWSTS